MITWHAIILVIAAQGLSSPVVASPPPEGLFTVQKIEVLPSPQREEDDKAVEALFETLKQGWRMRDASVVASVYADNAKLGFSSGETINGRDQIEAYLRGQWTADAQELATEDEVNRLEFARHLGSSNSMIFYGLMRCRDYQTVPANGGGSLYGTFFLEKIDGDWQIIRHSTSVRSGAADEAPQDSC